MAAEYRTGQPVMGTILQVTVVAPTRERARYLAETAIRRARHWDDVLTTWRARGELAKLNHASGRTVAVSSDLATALALMLRMYEETEGAFDPGVAAQVSYFQAPPSLDGSAVAKPVVHTPAALRLQGRQARLAPATALDPGGIGKGIALEAIERWLRAQRVSAAFLDFGGSSQTAIGHPPDTDAGWPVVVAGEEAGVILGTIALRDQSLSTSRSSGPGDSAGPIIDPKTGVPVAAGRLVSVLTASAARADAWSTALIVSGKDGLPGARRHGIEALIDEGGSITTTDGFSLLLQENDLRRVHRVGDVPTREK